VRRENSKKKKRGAKDRRAVGNLNPGIYSIDEKAYAGRGDSGNEKGVGRDTSLPPRARSAMKTGGFLPANPRTVYALLLPVQKR